MTGTGNEQKAKRKESSQPHSGDSESKACLTKQRHNEAGRTKKERERERAISITQANKQTKQAGSAPDIWRTPDTPSIPSPPAQPGSRPTQNPLNQSSNQPIN
ncbi:uncharacterized protein K452DRAFT_285654, partial [Aplosporella prunicola CBS 121167]